MAKSSPELIYHYTTAAGLRGIVCDDYIRASHISCLNDRTEFSSGVECFRNITREIAHDEIKKFVQEKEKTQKSILKTISENAVAESISHGIASAFAKTIDPYVTSFCTHEAGSPESANGLLSQWRAYGSDGGYCIAFNNERLSKIVEADAMATQDVCERRAVEYNDHNKLVHKKAMFIRRMCTLIRAELGEGEPDPDPIIIQNFENFALFFKNKVFSEENEYRYCFTRTQNPDGVPSKPIYFTDRGGLLVPHVRIGENQGIRHCIEKIIIGPGKDAETRRVGIIHLKKALNLKAEIVLSSTPLR